MIFSICFNFSIGQFISRNKKILILGIFFNVFLILYFKYAYFIVENIQNIASASWGFERIALPLGISFFTFQQIAYLVDTYYGSLPERNFLKYALLVSFFPHSIAGPLVQYKEIGPQFDGIKLSSRNFAIGGTIFIIGLFKKVIIADGLAPCVNAIFEGVSGGIIPSFVESWFGAIGYTLQLYFDFSGYSDMAIGLAKIFNVNFPINFNSPYKATSIIDFWKRWHITLSSFLRKYVYIPLGGNRQTPILRYRNLLLTMLIGGIWHGANWTFIFWGLLHGVYLIVNHLWKDFVEKNNISFFETKAYSFLAWSITMVAVIFGWVIFRAENFKSAIIMCQSMIGFQGISLPPSLESFIPKSPIFSYKGFFSNQLFSCLDYFPLMICSVIICLFFPNIKYFFRDHMDFHENSTVFIPSQRNGLMTMRWSPSLFYSVFIACCSAWVFLALLSQRKIEFLYFNF